MKNNVHKLIEEIMLINVLQKRFIKNSLASLSNEIFQDLESYITYCIKCGYSIKFLSQSYNLIANDTLKEQIFFKKHKKYRNSCYKDVSASVYYNDDYMEKYMIGLALTTFLWPNHLSMANFFASTIPQNRSGKYLEIGPGHGFYFMNALRNTKYSNFTGVDISPTSVKLTKNILNSGCFGKFSHYQIIQQNFLDWNDDMKFDAIVMGEVLEHVEAPILFLKKIKEMANSNSYIYVTTCINSPAIDHIYLFNSISDVYEHVNSAGLSIKKTLPIPYGNTSLKESEEKSLPINIAMVLNGNE